MPKRKNVKTNIDDETDRSCRESSSDGSVLENPSNNGTKNSKSRKCKVQSLNKTPTILNKRANSRKKRLSESSCDSMVKEVTECNLSKVDEEISPDDKNMTMTEQSSSDPVEISQEPIPDKENKIPINSDKYSELMNILGGKEGNIDTFIKQYKIWHQSQSKNGKQFKIKKNVTKSSTLKQTKTKAKRVTPLIKLTSKSSSKKNKEFNNISSVVNQDDMKEPDISISENRTNNTDSLNSSVPENNSTDIKNGDCAEGIDTNIEDENPKETTKDIVDCCKDVQTDIKSETVTSKWKSKIPRGRNNIIPRGKRKLEELSKEEAQKCSDHIDTLAKVGDEDVEDNSQIPVNTTSDQNSGSKEMEVSDKEDPYVAPEVTSIIVSKIGKSVSEGESNLKNEQINNAMVDLVKKDLFNDDKISEICENNNILDRPDFYDLFPQIIQKNNDKNDINSGENADDKDIDEVKNSNDLQNNDLDINDSISEIAINDLSYNKKTNQSYTDNSLDSTFNNMLSKSKSHSCSSLTNIESYTFDGSKLPENKNKEKPEDEGVISAILDVTNSISVEGDLETDLVWKRKRRMSDDNSECSKRTKHHYHLQSETKSEEPHCGKNSLETSFKWNNEESNSFFEELIYSDEEKNNVTVDDIINDSPLSSDEPIKCKENLRYKIKNINARYDLDINITEKSNSIKSNHPLIDENFSDSPGHSKQSINYENFDTPQEEVNKEWKENKHIKAINKDWKKDRNTKSRVCDSSKDIPQKEVDKESNKKSTKTANKDCREDRNTKSVTKDREREKNAKDRNKEWKENKHAKDEVCDSFGRSKHREDKDKMIKISSKSKKQMKSKVKSKSKKSSSSCKDDIKDLQAKDKYDCSYQSMLKKVKKHLKNGHRSILETDLPVVEVSYKGESLHGILGSVDNVDFLTRYKLYKEARTNEDLLNSSCAQGILIKSLRPLCPKMVRQGSCRDPQKCKKEHSVPNNFFISMDKHDAWMIIAFILNISCCLSGNILTPILEFLSKNKAKKKILHVCRHVFQSHQKKFPIPKSCWENILVALECCGLQRWEGITYVLQFIVDTQSSLKAEVFHQLLNIWNIHRSSISNTWQIVEPLVNRKIIVLQPSILSKLLGEIMAVEPRDKINVYRLIVQQLMSLTKDNFNQISYRLLNDFLRKVSQEGLHSEEKLLREIMNASYYSPFLPQQASAHTDSLSLRRSRSLTNLTNISSDSKFHINTKVHEEEKMEAAVLRALQCLNYDSVIKVIIASCKKVFINNVLLVVFKYASESEPYGVLKNIFIKLKTSFAQYVDEIKDLIGSIVVTLMLEYVKQYNWKEANNYLNLIEENHVNKYKLKSLTDETLRPVRLAVVYSEIHYYNGRFKESIGIFIDTRLINPDSAQWTISGGSKEDLHIISVMIVFLLNELINKNVINIATMLFKAVLEVQNSISKPIDIGHFFEMLLYKLFELTDEYPETAVKLYMRVIAKDSNVTLYGLTYRVLIILAFRTHKRGIIKDIFYKAINEYVYPIIEENENVIMLLRSHTEEEIIVYILEWVARFKEKQSDSCNHQIQIRFKDAVLEDYLDNKALGIPALLKEVDQTLPGAFKRLESVLKRLHIKFKQIKKNTFSVDPLSFHNFLNKIKIY